MEALQADTQVSQLAELEAAERAISDRRRELHNEIDRLYLAAPLDTDQMAQLDELEAIELSVSRERRKLHETIDELCTQIGLPPLARTARTHRPT